MKNKNFTEGFVQTCLENGLNIDQVKGLLQKQACVDLFNNEAFAKGFKSVVGDLRYENMTILEKAACIEKLKTDLQAEK